MSSITSRQVSVICLAPQFPHPNLSYIGEHIDSSWWYKRRYRTGYNITHLARTKYIQQYAYTYGMSYPTTKVAHDTTFDEAVYEDYAKTTIPRIIDYTTGLANHFFRGLLSAETECIGLDEIRLNITNNSNNSEVEQVLKGGTFKLYWDGVDGDRTEVNPNTYTVFDSDDPQDPYLWNSNSTLGYGESIRIEFTKPDGVAIVGFMVVYKGAIELANEIDHYDQSAVAMVAVENIDSPVFADDCCQFLNIAEFPRWVHDVTYEIGDKVSSYACYVAKVQNINERPDLHPELWTKVSLAYPLDESPNWNLGGYGGIGRTPKYMRVTFNSNNDYNKIGFYRRGGSFPDWFYYGYFYPHNPGWKGTFLLTQIRGCGNGGWSKWMCIGDPYSYRGFWEIGLQLGLEPHLYCIYFPNPFWLEGRHYDVDDIVAEPNMEYYDRNTYVCRTAHFATAATKPISGEDYGDYWALKSYHPSKQEAFAISPMIPHSYRGRYDDVGRFPAGYYRHQHYENQWYIANKDNPEGMGDTYDNWWESDDWAACGTPNIMLANWEFNKPIQNNHMGGEADWLDWFDRDPPSPPIAVRTPAWTGGTALITPSHFNPVPSAEWVKETNYTENESVSYNNKEYYAIQDHTSYPNNVAWNSGITYSIDDFAWEDGTCYTSKQNNNLNHIPPNGTWWVVTIPQGEDEPEVGADWEDYWELTCGTCR